MTEFFFYYKKRTDIDIYQPRIIDILKHQHTVEIGFYDDTWRLIFNCSAILTIVEVERLSEIFYTIPGYDGWCQVVHADDMKS